MSILRKNLARDYSLTISWRFAEVEFLGLPNLKQERVFRLEEIYVPLRLSRDWSDRFNKSKTFYVPKVLQEQRHIIVLGEPGGGKSTLVKVLTYAFGEVDANAYKRACGELIPIPIILREYQTRRWRSYHDMLRDFVATLDGDIRDEVTPEWLLGHLREGKAILLIDGIDEVGHREDRLRLRNEVIFPLLSSCPNSYAVLTSRIVGYEDVPFDFALATVFESREDTEGTVELLPLSSSPIRFYVSPFDDEQIAQFITRWYQLRESTPHKQREGVESLTSALGQKDRLKRLAHNPQLLTLIALIHRVMANLPSGRVELYDMIVEAYLQTIQTYRKLGTPAKFDEMKRWLAKVGWEMQLRRDEEIELRPYRDVEDLHVSSGEISCWLVEVMTKSREHQAAEELATKFLRYVTERSGLLIQSGPNLFTFAHLTFQEYFAAFELRRQATRFERLAETCAALATKAHWHETLILLFEMLTEFSDAGDDLYDVIAARVEGDTKGHGVVTKLFSSLLLDEESGLSEVKQKEAATFTLEAVCDRYNEGVMNDLQTLSAERRNRFLRPWFERRLSEVEQVDFKRYFFVCGAELFEDWPGRLLEWVVSPTYRRPADLQVAEIILIGALHEESYQRICPWAVDNLPLNLWLRRISHSFGDAGGLTLAEVYRQALYSSPTDLSRHLLLTELSIALSIRKSQALRITAAILGGALTYESSPVYYTDRHNRKYDSLHYVKDDPDRVTDEIRRRIVNEASARVPQRDLAREYAFNLSLDGSREVARLLAQAMALEGATAVQSYHMAATTSARLRTLLAAEPALFMPDAPTAKLQAKLRRLLRERDNWSQLLASSALLMLGKGTPELCRDRNALLAKAIEHGSQFTFPAELCAETEREEFRNHLPELLHLTFLQSTTHSWLQPEFFEPERPESAYFLSPPRKFFTLAAEVLDPGGDTELAKWREP